MTFAKLRILLWKNWVLQKRRPISGIFQILLPIAIVALFAWLNNIFENLYGFFENRYEGEFLLTNFSMCNKTVEKVFYTPTNDAYDRLIQKAFEDQNFETRGFYNSSLMYQEINNLYPESIARIELLSDSLVTTELPKNLTHNIMLPFFEPVCLVVFQNHIERAFVELSSNLEILGNVLMRSFPYDDLYTQIFTIVLVTVMPFFLVFSTFLMVGITVKSIASERESKMKELMKIMGLSSFIHWLSWFIKCKIMTTITYTIVTVFLYFPIFGSSSIFEYSNFFIIWLFFFIYWIGVITFCFMVSTFFSKASSASNVGVMLFFTTFIPYYVYGGDFEYLNYAAKWFYLLPINTSFGQGIFMCLAMELNQRGITFSNLFTHYDGFNFSLGEVFIAMLLSSVIHIFLTYYIEMVFPGDVGVPKPWHFPVTSCIRLIRKKDKASSYQVNNDDSTFMSKNNFEEEPKHLNAKVRIVNMTKKFGNFTAVNNFSLNIYEDQITVLLGHNGGGKTTTMNVLTGILPPTNGTAFINGFDITTEIEEARKSLGICPQHNILFNDLTVREHLIFFCRLKGMENAKEIDEEIRKYLSLMDFIDKKNERSNTLSGGQKRKLSIANALCGNSQFVVLDEPTSGLDVNARRYLWDLLIQEKKNRTILLTTHYMDEAEVLGDRIAIMSDGALKTVGTSFFLKKKFGSGYRLIVVKASNCDSKIILDVLQSYAPDSTIESEEQLEITFILSDEYIDKFQSIFKHLEDNMEKLRIQSLGCSLATLEEVFLKIGDDHDNSHETAIKFNDLMSYSKVSTSALIINQMYALILKKIHFTRRNYLPIIIYTLLSAWFLFVFLFAPAGGPSNSIDFFQDLSGLVNAENSETSIVQSYKNLFSGSPIEFTDMDIREFVFRNFLDRNQKYQIGASFEITSNTVWHNFHSIRGDLMPIALNFYYRAILHDKIGTEYDIRLRYSPLDFNYGSDAESTDTRDQYEDIMVYIMFFLVLMFWSSLHITLKIKERVARAKLLQFISGVNSAVFTLTSFLLDSLITICIIYIILGIVVATGRDGFSTFEEVSVFLIVLPMYIINAIPFIYIMSFWFVKHATGETISMLYPMAFAILYALQYTLYQEFPNVIVDAITDFFAPIIYYFSIFFAPFSLIEIYVKLQAILLYKEGEIWSFGDRGMGINLCFMAAGSVIFLTLVLLKDYSVFTWIRYKLSRVPKNLPPISSIDDDVLAEIDRVREKSASQIIDSNLVLRGLTKRYANLFAVNQLHVGVEPAECFGLLGVNGAGKTSVFKMLTGDEMITSGNSWVRGRSLINEKSKVYRDIGYCPQYDALLNELTGRETIKIFCLLRGVPRNQIDDMTEAFAFELDFTKYLDVTVGAYSGGNKRKLSTCLSLLGNLSLIFLDECSSGIDARAKRQLWDAIKKARSAGKAIVISSHSMQECESLCTRLAIMVDGEFQCIGSIQHIKNKFSKGFILKIMMSQRDDENQFNVIHQRIASTFPNSELKERFMGLLTFHIDVPELKWSDVFAKLSAMKVELGINDYTLTQASLESVFLYFSQRGKRKVE